MRIDRLHVQNFRGFEDREFTFHPHFNVLIGDNGSGKTALLRALRVAVASWFLGIKNQSTVGIRKDDVRFVGRAFDAGEFTFEEQWPVEVTAHGVLSFADWIENEPVLQWARTLNGPKGRTTSRNARPIKKVAQEADQRVRKGEDVVLPALAYYSTSRLYLEPRRTQSRKQTPDERELSRFVGYRDCIDKRLDSKALEAWMKRQGFAAWKEGGASTLYRLVRSAIAEMVEDACDVEYNPQREQVVVVFKDDSVYPLDYLSDGQRTMLTLVGDLATRMVRLNPQLGASALEETPGVVLIDELDLHLHPTWQRHVVRDLKRIFPRVQFVTTSHSPFIVQTLDSDELIALDTPVQLQTLGNEGIERIARALMGIERPDVSPEYEEMVEAAKDYLLELEEAKDAPEDKLNQYEERLAERIAPYADNPAFQAFLELEKAGKLSD